MNSIHKTLIAMLFLMVAAVGSAAGKDGFTVVLDPGHGGKDYGAVGVLTNEKTINLNVALEVRKNLAGVDGLNVIMTRDDDRFIALQERANIANRNHGDLFVSIHVNSVAKTNKNRLNIAGASVYTLGLHRTASNLEVAKRENAVMELESDYSTKYQGFDPNSTESYIMFELSQNKHLTQSIKFADMTVARLSRNAGRRNRGVLQAGFWVLHASAMPSVLIELDFICNPTCEKFLHSQEGVEKMGRAIADAIIQYSGGATASGQAEEPADSVAVEPKEAKPVVEVEKLPAANGQRKVAPLEKLPVAEKAPSKKKAEEESPKRAATASGDLTYRVQIIASSKQISADSEQFRGIDKVEEYRQSGWYKYTAGGDFETEEAAEAYAREHLRKSFPQSFVIKWQNGTRVK